ncbi:MAG: hypothetical protein H0W72_01825 [Planctomycetes bacterium]|nr:hypothetical protein [Planctomycetota bacterium]
MAHNSRSGAILIMVIGLSMMLLTLAIAFLVRMRSDVDDVRLSEQQAQARIMLHAGMMYLQEGSRLGWTSIKVGTTVTQDLGQAFGWTDIRDGSLGPKGARPKGANPGPAGILAPTWWDCSPAYQPYPRDSDLPLAHLRHWPFPGSVMRGQMPVWKRTPYAITRRFNANPLVPPVAYSDPAFDTAWAAPSTQTNWSKSIFYDTPGFPLRFASAYDTTQGALGMLNPQPVADTWNDYARGQLSSGYPDYRPQSQAKAWFRVYRELLADHDNNGDPWYDRVALYDPSNHPSAAGGGLANWNVFIITCGAGGTRGYRFWDLPATDERRAYEPVTAKESGLFFDQSTFEAIARAEYRMWFRVEWTGCEPGTPQGEILGLGENRGWQDQNRPYTDSNGNTTYPNSRWGDLSFTDKLGCMASELPAVQGGGFKWIQRLYQEPAYTASGKSAW